MVNPIGEKGNPSAASPGNEGPGVQLMKEPVRPRWLVAIRSVPCLYGLDMPGANGPAQTGDYRARTGRRGRRSLGDQSGNQARGQLVRPRPARAAGADRGRPFPILPCRYAPDWSAPAIAAGIPARQLVHHCRRGLIAPKDDHGPGKGAELRVDGWVFSVPDGVEAGCQRAPRHRRSFLYIGHVDAD
jgi:hypothetical protein